MVYRKAKRNYRIYLKTREKIYHGSNLKDEHMKSIAFPNTKNN